MKYSSPPRVVMWIGDCEILTHLKPNIVLTALRELATAPYFNQNLFICFLREFFSPKRQVILLCYNILLVLNAKYDWLDIDKCNVSLRETGACKWTKRNRKFKNNISPVYIKRH